MWFHYPTPRGNSETTPATRMRHLRTAGTLEVELSRLLVRGSAVLRRKMSVDWDRGHRRRAHPAIHFLKAFGSDAGMGWEVLTVGDWAYDSSRPPPCAR